ncbi:MAG TPA: hypothetical protein VJR47_15050 [Stellaceae bacterium]|nr:hypothetical protein [Stellaceae bacterium]
MPSRYSQEDQDAYFRMLAVVGTRWEEAIGRADYRNTTAWNLLTRLWRARRVKMSAAYDFMPEVKSPTTRRLWLQKAIADGVIDCADAALVAALRRGQKPALPRGQNSPEVWLNPEISAKIDRFMDDVLDELLKTAASVRAHQVG